MYDHGSQSIVGLIMNKLDYMYVILFVSGMIFGAGLYWLYLCANKYLFKTPLKLIKGGKYE